MLASSHWMNNPRGRSTPHFLCEKWDRLLFKNADSRDHDGQLAVGFPSMPDGMNPNRIVGLIREADAIVADS